MKKVMRSPVLKGIAFVLCLVCVAVAGLTLGNATQWFCEKSLEDGGFPYEMDASFDESDLLNRQFPYRCLQYPWSTDFCRRGYQGNLQREHETGPDLSGGL